MHEQPCSQEPALESLDHGGEGLLVSLVPGLVGEQGDEYSGGVLVDADGVGDELGVGLAGVRGAGEVHAEGGAERLAVEGDADEAFLWPVAEAMAHVADDVGRAADSDRFHCPAPPV